MLKEKHWSDGIDFEAEEKKKFLGDVLVKSIEHLRMLFDEAIKEIYPIANRPNMWGMHLASQYLLTSGEDAGRYVIVYMLHVNTSHSNAAWIVKDEEELKHQIRMTIKQ